MLSRVDAKEITFRFEQDLLDVPQSLQQFGARKDGKRTLVVRYSPKEISAGHVIAMVQQNGLVITDISTDDRDLEDVFLQLTR